MSVQSNTYVMVGVMLPYDELTEQQHNDSEAYQDSAYKGIQHHNGLCVIADGMNGRYVAIGRVLAKTDDQNGNYGIDKPIDGTAAMTPDLHHEVQELLREHFEFKTPDVRVWIFTHYR